MTVSREHSSLNRAGARPDVGYVDTREGWREVNVDEARTGESVRYASRDTMRYWVRVPPVPPLPTVPNTVIRVTWGTEYHSVLLVTEDGWVSQFGSKYNADDLAQITSFKVLSEPRAVTAKAVLDRVREEFTWLNMHVDFSEIAREFKVVES